MRKVIVVDDNELSVEGICKNIDWTAMGAEVCASFSNARDVLAWLERADADLIISDISMPQMSGLEMSRAILQTNPHMKIILISAYDDFEYAKEAVRLGVCDYVEKPIDYSYLRKVVEQTLKQSQQEREILEQLKQSRPALIQQFFNDLIHATPDYAEYHLADQAKYIGLDLSHVQYMCAVIQIDNFMEMKNTFGIERYHVRMMTLAGELAQSFPKHDLVHCGSQGSSILVILGSKDVQGNDFPHAVYRDFLVLNERHENAQLSITIGIGDPVASIWNVSASFQNARHAAGYKFIFGEGHIFSIQDIRRNNPSPVVFTVGAEEKLIRLISQKDLAGIRQFTDELTTQLSERYYDKNGVIAYIYSLLARLIRFFYDTGIESGPIRSRIAEAFADLERFHTCAQICGQLYEICVLSCDKLKESVESYHNQIAERVVNYIESHYMEVDLGLNDIAASVNVSPTYLGSVFKKARGQNISEYITEVRVNKARDLLRHTNMKIMEISDKVGYSNQYYFSACFKKRTGVTPTDFRSKITG
ncbi:MAG TPA: response regulator [Paenibacillus sp.]|uniref:response regulator n=1 Tax=Paenibacillus sp. TaxID=58172 RepID=UPI002BC73098|nr:response regulator [Paenibacillus sp.]HUC91403.1 response regulator [Paenibacillus sp.]